MTKHKVTKRSASGRGVSGRRNRAAGDARRDPGSGRVHLYVGISLDGYIAAPGGGVDWLTPYGDAGAGFAPFMKTIGSAIMGRVTYDHAVARGYSGFGKTPAYVVTHRPFPSPSASVIPFSGNLSDLLEQIRGRHPGDIWLMGGGGVTRSFLEADLIDIWSIGFVPALLGAGIPMFPPGEFFLRRLQLVSTRRYPSGVIELRYERASRGSVSHVRRKTG